MSIHSVGEEGVEVDVGGEVGEEVEGGSEKSAHPT